MTNRRRALLILDGPGLDAQGIASSLEGPFDITFASPQQAVTLLSSGAFDAVLANTDEFMPLERALFETDATALLAAIGEGVCLAADDGRILWSNERFRAYDEQIRSRIGAVCRRAAQSFQDRLTEQGDPGAFESAKYEVACDDVSRFYEVLVSPVDSVASTAPNGRVRVAAVVWDVTTSRRLQHRMEAVDKAGAELVRLDSELISKMHAGQRLKVLEDKIVAYAHELMHFDHFAIRLVDEETNRLEIVMASGLPPEAMESEILVAREGNGISGYVAATGRSYLCPDVSKDRRYVAGIKGAASSLTVPLRLHDKVIGVFNVESETPSAFTEEDRQFAEIFANHVALAIHILDLLRVERVTTGQSLTGTVETELSEPLEDILHEADWLKNQAEQAKDQRLRAHVDRIMQDVQAIRRRVRQAAEGPQTILGADVAMAEGADDPVIAGKRVLVADDAQKIRQIIRDVLRARGARVVCCDDGAAAIDELIATTPAVEGEGENRDPFDLIISDIKMPDRNGYEVFSAAKRVDENLPVILMTGFGYDPHHSIVRASSEGLQAVLFKPFQINRLLDEVHKALTPSTSSA